MSHVRIERLGSGHGEDDRPHCNEGARRLLDEEGQEVQRIDRRQDHLWPVDDVHHAEHRDRHEIEEHDRPEQCSDARRAVRLDGEQPDENADRDGNDARLRSPALTVVRPSTADRTEIAGVIIEVAVEERGGEHAEQDDARSSISSSRRSAD